MALALLCMEVGCGWTELCYLQIALNISDILRYTKKFCKDVNDFRVLLFFLGDCNSSSIRGMRNVSDS